MWTITIAGSAFALLCIALGVYLSRPTWHDPVSRANLGVALMTGAVVSVAVLILQAVNEVRVNRVDDRRQLLLTLATSTRLDGFNMSGADLAGQHLGSKFFVEARFNGANLKHANLSRSHFERAWFEDAQLQGADLTASDLGGAHLRGARLSGDTALNSTCLRNADLRGADLRATFTTTDVWRAQYDAKTTWPARQAWPVKSWPPACQDAEGCILRDRAYIVRGVCG